MKCTRCKAEAHIRLPSHNAKFCGDCFDLFFLSAVRKALKLFWTERPGRIAVAVSGGKDSLAAWDALNRLGYQTLGLHLDLGVKGFSQASREAVEVFAAERGLDCRIRSLAELWGRSLPEVQRRTRREICSICGQLKRSFLNRLAVEEGCAWLATGHHLDDEAGRLLGNLVRHRQDYLDKFYPCLPAAHPRQASRIKPLYRLDAGEIRTYVAERGIRPLTGITCPFNKGATSHYFQQALQFLEEKMPGTKRDFLYVYLQDRQPPREESFGTCAVCGQPTWGQLCSVCRLRQRLEERKEEA